MWRLPIPELAAKSGENGEESENSDEKIKNLLKVVQLLRQVQSQKAQQGKLLIATFTSNLSGLQYDGTIEVLDRNCASKPFLRHM